MRAATSLNSGFSSQYTIGHNTIVWQMTHIVKRRLRTDPPGGRGVSTSRKAREAADSRGRSPVGCNEGLVRTHNTLQSFN